MNDIETVDRCLACNSVRLNTSISTSTMMAPKTRSWSFDTAEYYTEYYLPYRGASAWGKYASLVDWDLQKIDKNREKTVLKYKNPKSKKTNSTVLDIGCGKPTFLRLMSNSGYKTIGVDFSNNGWKDNEEAFSEIELIAEDPKNISLDHKADIITMWHYLEHDYNPFATLNHLLDNSNSKAKLIIEVPNFDSSSRKKFGTDWAGFHTPRHTALYTPDNMRMLIERSGWKFVDSYSHGTLDPYTLDWMSRMERASIDWSKNMESRFKSFVIGKLIRPYYCLDRLYSQGFMTLIAEKPD